MLGARLDDDAREPGHREDRLPLVDLRLDLARDERDVRRSAQERNERASVEPARAHRCLRHLRVVADDHDPCPLIPGRGEVGTRV